MVFAAYRQVQLDNSVANGHTHRNCDRNFNPNTNLYANPHGHFYANANANTARLAGCGVQPVY